MLIDTHLHESKYSKDSFVSLEDIVIKAKEIGLDGICITDHDNNEIADEAAELMRKTGFLIITGAEVLTLEGDMTVFGLKDLPAERTVHAWELMEKVEKAGGIAICSHPYRQNNRGMGDLIKFLKDPWGVEAFNGNTKFYQNMHAYEVASRLAIPCLGGSDAHHVEEVGRYATFCPDGIRDGQDLIAAVKAKEIYPVILHNSCYFSVEAYQELNKVG